MQGTFYTPQFKNLRKKNIDLFHKKLVMNSIRMEYSSGEKMYF